MLREMVENLEIVLPALPAKDREFAKSLVAAGKLNKVSEKQKYWIKELYERALKAADLVPGNAAPKAEPVNKVGEFASMIALFNKASSSLKHPRITLSAESGEQLVLTVAGPNASLPGTINVASPGRFGENVFYGRIRLNGEFTSGRAQMSTALLEVLKAFALNPAETAAAHGKKTGFCCFCSKKLTDKRSTEVGYGPWCAEKFGLSWG
jgi:Family of unknown function (DUF6011)